MSTVQKGEAALSLESCDPKFSYFTLLLRCNLSHPRVTIIQSTINQKEKRRISGFTQEDSSSDEHTSVSSQWFVHVHVGQASTLASLSVSSGTQYVACCLPIEQHWPLKTSYFLTYLWTDVWRQLVWSSRCYHWYRVKQGPLSLLTHQ